MASMVTDKSAKCLFHVLPQSLEKAIKLDSLESAINRLEPSRAAAKNQVALVLPPKGSTALKVWPLLVETQTFPYCPTPN